MRKLLVLAFLLCKCIALIDDSIGWTYNDVQGHNYIADDIISIATRLNNYDYDDIDGAKRHPMLDEKRNWRKKALSKSLDDHRDWDGRRRYEYDNPRFMDDMDSKSLNGIDRQKEMDHSTGYRSHRYEDAVDKMSLPGLTKSSEISHSSFADKDADKKQPIEMNCHRAHEKYESCFAGCASVTCDNPRDRMQPCYPFCEAGCVCVHPYVRDDRTHKCVLPEECTKGLKGIPDLGEDTTT